MNTSELGGRIAMASGEANDNDPLDTSIVHSLTNNAQHLADEQAQVRVAWCALAGEFITTRGVDAGPVGTWFPLATFGPFPVSAGPSGGYAMRCRLHGSADAANTVTFRAIVAPILERTAGAEAQLLARIRGNGPDVLEAATASTTAAWLAATGSATLIVPMDNEGLAPMAVAHEASGSTAYDTAQVNLMAIHVWAKTADSGTQPQLSGVYLAEYVGT